MNNAALPTTLSPFPSSTVQYPFTIYLATSSPAVAPGCRQEKVWNCDSFSFVFSLAGTESYFKALCTALSIFRTQDPVPHYKPSAEIPNKLDSPYNQALYASLSLAEEPKSIRREIFGPDELHLLDLGIRRKSTSRVVSPAQLASSNRWHRGL